jgi:hypothetical protein
LRTLDTQKAPERAQRNGFGGSSSGFFDHFKRVFALVEALHEFELVEGGP